MLTELLAHLRNWFLIPHGIHPGTYTISEGSITLPFLLTGQYFRVVGSVFNDGVYQYPAAGLTNETFCGAVWALAIPPAVITVAAEIETWKGNNGESPYTAESFGGYSYTRATGAGGQPITWQEAFRVRLNQWRKV